MRYASRFLRIPSGAAHRHDRFTLERVSGGRSRLAHEARRSATTADHPDLAASARDVQVLAQVRVGPRNLLPLTGAKLTRFAQAEFSLPDPQLTNQRITR